jgi:hypothetical protein
MLLAREAPDWMDAMAISSRATGYKVVARLRCGGVITECHPKVRQGNKVSNIVRISNGAVYIHDGLGFRYAYTAEN